jgi:peptidylprolyl isomerase domain and WD repeat-containing protein 1
LDRLPNSAMYERSYLHRDVVSHVLAVPGADFFVTASVDGFVKFWKKNADSIEFVKMFRCHTKPITALCASHDASFVCSASTDRTAKLYDVKTFDMISILSLAYEPGAAEFAFRPDSPTCVLAIAALDSPAIHLYDARAEHATPLASATTLHRQPVHLMRFNAVANAVVSCDVGGAIEYWSAADDRRFAFPADAVAFKFKMDTDLLLFLRAKLRPVSLAISADGERFATLSSDRHVRVFSFKKAKVLRDYDESLAVALATQSDAAHALHLESIDFGRRMALEREIDGLLAQNPRSRALGTVLFDASGHFLLYPTLVGIKVVNIETNALAHTLGFIESGVRSTALALYQGKPARDRTGSKSTSAVMDASGAAVAVAGEDPTLIACAVKSDRFYVYSRREPSDDEPRDIFNERPRADQVAAATAANARAANLARYATVHTTRGDIRCRLFLDECPRTVENFCTHARTGYFNNLIFHRVIKNFMIQTGDPKGDGTGGESIWGKDFEDEFDPKLKHDRPGVLSMANCGPNTNGSQFFITCAAVSRLDGKHTVFGRVVSGMDTVNGIERVQCDKNDRPIDDIKIVSVTVDNKD